MCTCLICDRQTAGIGSRYRLTGALADRGTGSRYRKTGAQADTTSMQGALAATTRRQRHRQPLHADRGTGRHHYRQTWAQAAITGRFF